MPDSPRLELAVKQLEFARGYTLNLLKDVEDTDWYHLPNEGVTHIAWQVGHLAMAEYALTMIRVRGKQPSDAEIMPNDFFRRFQKGSKPDPDPSNYPNPAEIRQVLGRVHQQALSELNGYTEAELDVKLPEPHAVFDTKLGSVLFCPAHELIHAGQIALLRRLLGKEPLR